ncbi:MAG: laccase domain-containing protein [Acidimicrobiales bacterium]
MPEHRPRLAGEELSYSFFIGELPVEVSVTTRRAGDLRPRAPGAAERQAQVLPGGPWSWSRQVHGSTVLCCGEHDRPGDALVGTTPGARPAMFAADCGLIGIASPRGLVAAVHVGWRGLRAGVIEATATAMATRGKTKLAAVRGPCIGPECYEFGEDDLDAVAGIYGPTVRAETADGHPALDLAAGMRAACDRAGIELVAELDSCTACARGRDGSPLWFSHRGRGDEGRHALVVSEPR